MAPSMFGQKSRRHYTLHILIVATVFSVLGIFVLLGRKELGPTIAMVLAMAMLAVGVRWELRRHGWFWAVVMLTLILHIPILSITHLPVRRGSFGLFVIADFLIFFIVIAVADAIAERFFPPSASAGAYEK